ncbi:DNA-directed DNA polymerase [Synchytrium endobioticum]|uniref:DNA-directed DNA polymerase n=1 Tax=Synchytrium endobioticum TaxID=286115 RepID=A0A507CT22_9FUNG|nr:DNA-directed DNA polymerase [Synchytrium endobioticum]
MKIANPDKFKGGFKDYNRWLFECQNVIAVRSRIDSDKKIRVFGCIAYYKDHHTKSPLPLVFPPCFLGEESESEDDKNPLIPPPSLVLSEILEEHEVEEDPEEEAIPIISAPPHIQYKPSNLQTGNKDEEVALLDGAMMIIPVRWVYAVKSDENGVIDRFKARVVAKGYAQIEGVDFDITYSPTLLHASLRTLFTITATVDLELHHLDVNTAFLNSEIDTDVYIERPEGFVDPEFPNHVLKLKKAIYGLKHASRLCMVGSLLYASNMTRPDIAAPVALEGQYVVDPAERHLVAVKRIGLRLGCEEVLTKRNSAAQESKLSPNKKSRRPPSYEAETSANQTERRAFMGFVNFYRAFAKDLSLVC